jgi:hypothetical protein
MVASKEMPEKDMELSPRFWSKVDIAPGCWNWIAGTTGAGYGRYKLASGRSVSAHRFIFSVLMGAIPPNLLVCHRCDNPRCVNPLHLFLGTARDNAMDMVAKGRNANGTEGMMACRRGHPRTPENTYRWRNSIHCLRCREVTRAAR